MLISFFSLYVEYSLLSVYTSIDIIHQTLSMALKSGDKARHFITKEIYHWTMKDLSFLLCFGSSCLHYQRYEQSFFDVSGYKSYKNAVVIMIKELSFFLIIFSKSLWSLMSDHLLLDDFQRLHLVRTSSNIRVTRSRCYKRKIYVFVVTGLNIFWWIVYWVSYNSSDSSLRIFIFDSAYCRAWP